MDSYERPEGNGNSFMMGLFAGTLLGAGLGLLLAPKSGSELRRQLRARAGELADSAEEGYRRAADTASNLADRGRDLLNRGRELGRDAYNRTRDAAARGADEAQGYVRDVASNVSDTTERR